MQVIVILLLRFVTHIGGSYVTATLGLLEYTSLLAVPCFLSKLLGYNAIYAALSLPTTIFFIVVRGGTHSSLFMLS